MNSPSFSPRIRPRILIVAVFGCFLATEAPAQEELLDRALADRDRKTAGMNSLAERVRGFFSWIPGMEVEEEETGPPVEASEVKMKAVQLVDTESTTEATVAQAAEAAAMEEAALYRQNLQMAASKLNISGAFPRTKEVMVGAKRLGIGEEIAIEYQGTLFDLMILDMTSSVLKLRDQKSQIEVNLSISVARELPPGMYRKAPADQFEVVPLAKPGVFPAPGATPAPVPAPTMAGTTPVAAPVE